MGPQVTKFVETCQVLTPERVVYGTLETTQIS